ncbi:MAG: sodium:calcium antiporter, partial [Candidatus Calescibacterium sp.]|nr:sodium:calcium antiporter [Candidatus Calescibacterium sp.]
DELKYHEILLTAAQSLFALIILLDFKFTIFKAVLIFLPFFVQLVNPSIRMEVTYIYLLLSFLSLFFVINKKSIIMLKESVSHIVEKIYKK